MNSRTDTNYLLEAALTYARYGWAVFPVYEVIHRDECACGKVACKDAGKHPRTRNGLKDATTDEATIQGWWQRWPDANVAVACGAESGLIVLDVDPRHHGDESLRA